MTARLQTAAALRALLAAILVTFVCAPAITVAQQHNVYSLQVDGLACPFCAYGIEKQLMRTPGVESVSTQIKTGTVTVSMAAGQTLDEADANRAVEAAGFTLRGFTRKHDAQ